MDTIPEGEGGGGQFSPSTTPRGGPAHAEGSPEGPSAAHVAPSTSATTPDGGRAPAARDAAAAESGGGDVAVDGAAVVASPSVAEASGLNGTICSTPGTPREVEEAGFLRTASPLTSPRKRAASLEAVDEAVQGTGALSPPSPSSPFPPSPPLPRARIGPRPALPAHLPASPSPSSPYGYAATPPGGVRQPHTPGRGAATTPRRPASAPYARTTGGGIQPHSPSAAADASSSSINNNNNNQGEHHGPRASEDGSHFEEAPATPRGSINGTQRPKTAPRARGTPLSLRVRVPQLSMSAVNGTPRSVASGTQHSARGFSPSGMSSSLAFSSTSSRPKQEMFGIWEAPYSPGPGYDIRGMTPRGGRSVTTSASGIFLNPRILSSPELGLWVLGSLPLPYRELM